MCQLRLYDMFDVVALRRPEHLSYIGQLDCTVRAHIGWQKTTFSLTDLSNSFQQFIEPKIKALLQLSEGT